MNQRVLEVLAVFTKFGFTAFGGPAAHVGMFRQEVVDKRHWVTDEQFMDLLGATNLIPGPNSTEMTIHLGYLRAGWQGMLAGGLGFTLPAMLIVLFFSYLYVKVGATPQAGSLFYAIKPVVIAIIIQALFILGRKSIKDLLTIGLGLAVIILYFLGVNELILLFGGALIFMLLRNWRRLMNLRPKGLPVLFLPWVFQTAGSVPFSMPVLFLTFLKIGAVLYGSGYVLIAFLQGDLVDRLGWLTQKQLIDAIAIGQITPGPLFTTATFIGYLLGGLPGGIVATVAIFLPSYFFVAISNPLIPKVRASVWAGSFLDGVIVASLGLMAAVCIQLALPALIDPLTVILFGVSLLLLFRFHVNTTWLIIGAAIIGLIYSWVKL
jgi:chromate transporter